MNVLSDKPLVSVIIPTYNRADLICQTLNSVLRQSYQNLEIIVVDDRSTDNTETVINSINDPRIRYLSHSTNQGGAAARNTGIDAAKGEYIAFLDSDDVWVANKLELQLASILQSDNPQRVVSYTQAFYSASGISESTYTAFDNRFFVPKRGKELTESLGDYLFCHEGKALTSTLILHRSLALGTRFRASLRKHQDWDFCLRLEARGAIFSFIQQPLTIWNGDPKLEHVGRKVDYRLSESFMTDCRTYVSSKAATAFLLDKVVPFLIQDGTRKLYCQKIFCQGLVHKLISGKQFTRITARLWLKKLKTLRKLNFMRRVLSS
ncbi:Glycosyl transferase family 2 [Hyella patelloides LEGE 07179]|uniref:Glycosyl transferase family 2 n=1 Tax=Hyella patelloides LEGE 07179 TaxID=945734 RepID=A0A563VLL1_9CYAN|nr:glycosyltransferase family 2 protein [Hyella patelloides]VEP12237.1 Glycosyl transferase family 2 [Hyella patelloides LEGE 07179]